MCNAIAFCLNANRGEAVILDQESHPNMSEAGGPAWLASVMLRPVAGPRGIFSVDQVRPLLNKGGTHAARTAFISVENTTNRGGGAIWPLERLAEMRALADERGLRLHMDGARLLNAAVASGIPAATFASYVDSVWVDLSKGLGAPVGAVLAGSTEFIERARLLKHMFGGAMRQAGIIAAGGIYAFEHNVERLAEDHANAQFLAEGLAQIPGVKLVYDTVPTNILFFDVSGTGMTPQAVERGINALGVRMGGGYDGAKGDSRRHPPRRDARRLRHRDRSRPPGVHRPSGGNRAERRLETPRDSGPLSTSARLLRREPKPEIKDPSTARRPFLRYAALGVRTSGAAGNARRSTMILSWKETRSGIVNADERLPWGQTIAMGFQHVLAMFGATVVAPIIMGFDPNLAILFSGIGTLIFFAFVGGAVPSYLGSSFAFIGPVAAVTGTAAASGAANGIGLALGGIVAAGVVYTLIGLIVHLTGAGWIDSLMPPLVTGAVVAIIGLNLAPAARNLAAADPVVAAITVLAIFVVGLLTTGVFSRLPILIGSVIGYLAALLLGGTSADGRQYLGVTVHGVDLAPVGAASWFGMPAFQAPEFNGSAMALIAPVAIVLVAENTGHVKAVSALTGRNLTPYLGRAFMGDGVATIVAGLRGGTGVTTYAENIGVMAVTRVYSTLVFLIAGIIAIIFGLSPKFGAIIGSIPQGVLGGVTTVLFGLIAVTGARIWVDNRVDFTRTVNLFVAAVTLIIGAADYTVTLGGFSLNGITLGTFAAIVLYQLFKGAPDTDDFAIVGDERRSGIRASRRRGASTPALRSSRRRHEASDAIGVSF